MNYSLIVDGKRVPKREACVYKWTAPTGFGTIYSNRAIAILSKAKFSDLPNEATWWDFHLDNLGRSLGLEFDLRKSDSDKYESYALVKISFDGDNWRNAWSITDFCNVFVEKSKPRRQSDFEVRFEDREIPSNGIEIRFSYPNGDALIGQEIERWRSFAEEIYRETLIGLMEKLDEDSLVVFFDFPDEYASLCKHYLVYFREFLRLAGVDSKVTVADESERVLLSVTPADGKAALGFVRAALGVYLKIPQAKIAPLPSGITDFSMVQVAKAVEQFRSTVGPIDQALPVSSLNREISEKAEFFGGRLVLKKFEKGPLVLDLPRIIRELRDKFPLLKRL